MSRVLVPDPGTTRSDIAQAVPCDPGPQTGSGRSPIGVHPWAWWSWALGGVVVMTMARNPLLLSLGVAAVLFVVLQRRTTDPWARSVRAYLLLGGLVIAIRVFFQIVVGGFRDGTTLFRLPEIPLPDWAAGIRLGGPVTLESLLFAFYDATRLAGLLICLGAANALANPKRALRSVPAAFHQIATANVIGLSVAPQLIESGRRIARARRLRGTPARGVRGAISLLVPVLEDAIERCLTLAAGMESRGYGRTRDGRRLGAGTTVVLVAAMLSIIFGTFTLLSLPNWQLPVALLVLGVVLSVFSLRASGRLLAVTRYRPDPWRGVENAVVACGLLAAGMSIWLSQTDAAMLTSTDPAEWPQLTPLMLVVVVLLAAPGVFTPAGPTQQKATNASH